MLKHVALSAAALLVAAACASNPAPADGSSSGAAASISAPGASAVAGLNLAASTQWIAEERLMPQQPILALVATGGTVEQSAGLAMTCNPDNGSVTGRLGRQSAARIGETATYTLRLGAAARPVSGKFEAGATGADFVFALDAAGLRAMTGPDIVSFVSDKGEVELALVRDPAGTAPAKVVGSLKNLATESQTWMVYCNPK